MKKFERSSQEECRELVSRMRGKTFEEIVAMFGPPARELGPRKEDRLADGVPWVVEFRRTVFFHGVGKTVHTLIVAEQTDGQFEFQMRGREIADENAA
jgi:hypothetical protein